MKRARGSTGEAPSAETLLQRAMATQSAVQRARYARQGLAHPGTLDPVIQSMLLRQLYLAHFEQRQFERAVQIAEQMLELGVLLDVCHQDAARALVLVGRIDSAAEHLRLAARLAPARRRAFHLWTLGSVLFFASRLDEAHTALERAVRWSSTDRALYAGHLALVRLAQKQPVPELQELIHNLEEAPCGQGYGRLVLGLLCLHAGRTEEAQRYLKAFVERTRGGRVALMISLSAELLLAEESLAKLGSDQG